MDRYLNFGALSASERQDQDFRIRAHARANSRWLVMAPHGGGIEPGTSEIASAVARGKHNCYKFEGTKRRGNGNLHITSTHFDEPKAIAMATSAESILSIHGEASTRKVVFIGGRDLEAQLKLKASLESRGFFVSRHSNQNLAGTTPSNICNRSTRGIGVQIELSLGLRQACFHSMSPNGRRTKTPTFRLLVAAIREGLKRTEV